MKYYTSTTKFNCGIDLHARQMYVCVMDRDGKKLVHTNIASLPGAGPVLGPRLLASLGSQRDRFGAATDLQHFTGIRVCSDPLDGVRIGV